MAELSDNVSANLATANSNQLEASLDDWASRDRAARLRLFVPEARSRAASTRLALGHALRGSLHPHVDPTVRHARASFWHEEIARCSQGSARHPLTMELQSGNPPLDSDLLAAAFQSLLHAVSAPVPALDSILEGLIQLQAALWFDGAEPAADGCRIRALCDLADWAVDQDTGLNTPAFDTTVMTSLRAARTADGWSAARREQILRSRDGRKAGRNPSRWKERLDAWAIWRAVRRARQHRNSPSTTGVNPGH